MSHPKYKHLEALDWSAHSITQNFFETIDPIIDEWVSANELKLFIYDRGWQIRQVIIVNKGMINIDIDNETSKITVSIKNSNIYDDNYAVFETDKDHLREILEQVLALTRSR